MGKQKSDTAILGETVEYAGAVSSRRSGRVGCCDADENDGPGTWNLLGRDARGRSLFWGERALIEGEARNPPGGDGEDPFGGLAGRPLVSPPCTPFIGAHGQNAVAG